MTQRSSHRGGETGRRSALRAPASRATLPLLATLAILVPAVPSRAAAPTAATPLQLVMSVRVVDATGWPIEHARVAVDGRRAAGAVTGADGRCTLRVPLGALRDLGAHPIDLTVRAQSRDQHLALTEGVETLRLEIALAGGASGGGTVRIRSNSAVAAAVIAAGLRALDSESIGLDVSFLATPASSAPGRSGELAAILDVEVPALVARAASPATVPPISTPATSAPASPKTAASSAPSNPPAASNAPASPPAASNAPPNPSTATTVAPQGAPSNPPASSSAPARPPAASATIAPRSAPSNPPANPASLVSPPPHPAVNGATVPPTESAPPPLPRLRPPPYASVRLQPRSTASARTRLSISKPIAIVGRPVALASDTTASRARILSVLARANAPSQVAPSRTSSTSPSSGSSAAVLIPPPPGARSGSSVFGTSGQTTRTMEHVISTPSNEVPVLTPSDAAIERDSQRACACRVTGTVELDWDRPLAHPLRVTVALLDDPAVCDTIWLYMGSPRAFTLLDVPCGAHRLNVRLPSRTPYDLATPESQMIFDCRRAPIRPMRVVLIRH